MRVFSNMEKKKQVKNIFVLLLKDEWHMEEKLEELIAEEKAIIQSEDIFDNSNSIILIYYINK